MSQLFYDSLALSAWKEHGEARWSLRVNPSSGNLHPTEAYLIADGLRDGPALFHYAPHPHALELRRALSSEEYRRGLPDGCFLMGLTSIHWRESWKYGERAFRYCHHDVGHAIGAIAIAASCQGYEARLVEAATDDEIGSLLGVFDQDGPEAEHPDCLIAVFPRGQGLDPAWRPDEMVVRDARAARYSGTPLPLSPEHQEWPVIDQVSLATEKLEPNGVAWAPPDRSPGPRRDPCPARTLIRRRRSAVDFDGTTRISRESFYRMLHSTLPGGVPFRTLPWRPRIHLAIFVHRVDDLEPGLYFFARTKEIVPIAKELLRKEFLWEPAPERPDLHLLVPADVRTAAELISCQQEIASHGAFALGMLGELEPALRDEGAFMYRRLHWEAGAIGQVLYLEAEAHGVQATGIGCFFDDVMHDLLGVSDRRLHTLYHFTVGGPVEDPRIEIAPAYSHRT